MQRHGGELIYHARDDDGALEVVDSHGVRALHFGTPPRQSALSLNDPQRLELAYVRAMLSPLLFADNPQNALVIGLGGGSMARFLLEQFPACQVDAVERRAKVTLIAHAFFGLPRDPRLRVFTADACLQVDALARQTTPAYDLILIDAYDHIGMDTSINAIGFIGGCARLLRPQG
ncbi:MAG: hypothetical protein ACKN9T_06915, partial [Candidatus Methylumidiphilus sp.]